MDTLNRELCSPSELLIRRKDVVQRYFKKKADEEEYYTLYQPSEIFQDPNSSSDEEPDCDLTDLLRHPDERWDDYNVLGKESFDFRVTRRKIKLCSISGQVVAVLREENSKDSSANEMLTQYVKIPAAYRSGITLCMLEENRNLAVLMDAKELPLKEP